MLPALSDAPVRIVVDTNTVISGLLWQGPSRRLLDLARAQNFTLCASATLIEELTEVIVREKFEQRIRAAGLSAKSIVEDYLPYFPHIGRRISGQFRHVGRRPDQSRKALEGMPSRSSTWCCSGVSSGLKT